MSQEEEKYDRLDVPPGGADDTGIRPPWIVQRGIGILFTLLCLLIVASIFVKVPRTVPAFVSGFITDTVLLSAPSEKEVQLFFTSGSMVKQGQPIGMLFDKGMPPTALSEDEISFQELEKTAHFFYHDTQLLRAPAAGKIYSYPRGTDTLAFIVPLNSGVALFSEIEAGSFVLHKGDPVSMTLGTEETLVLHAAVDSLYSGSAAGRVGIRYRLSETDRHRLFTYLRGKGTAQTSGTAEITIGTESFFKKVSRNLFQRNYSTP